MPELPEVETYRRQLKEHLLGKTINSVIVSWKNTIAFPSVGDFINQISGQMVEDIKRRGKWLLIELSDYYLIVHLRMEGKFFLKSEHESVIKHEHVIFNLDSNEQLRFHDTRKFGKMILIEKDKLKEVEQLKNLGLEPFDEELTVKYLKDKYKHKTLPIKTVLLDQSIITGIGNIYADEILFLSKINPLTKAKEISAKKLKLIIINTRNVLEKAIELGGTTIRSYVSLGNRKGSFQEELYVHQRKGLPCRVCNTSIEKIVVNGRGTYFCPKCQKYN
jgi:formamidopyrimidine-DNA glycosylase